jgi:hypothetical protein
MLWQLGVLAVLTVAAIVTDGLWDRSAADKAAAD